MSNTKSSNKEKPKLSKLELASLKNQWGSARMINALIRKGLLDERHELTEAGRAAIKA